MTKLPRNNAYRCEYGCITVTVDVDKGVTPFMMSCLSEPTKARPIAAKYLNEKGVCKGEAKSCFYPKVQLPKHLGEPTHEWYKPNEEDILRIIDGAKDNMDVNEAQYERVIREAYENGQLDIRPRTKREPVYHE